MIFTIVNLNTLDSGINAGPADDGLLGCPESGGLHGDSQMSEQSSVKSNSIVRLRE